MDGVLHHMLLEGCSTMTEQFFHRLCKQFDTVESRFRSVILNWGPVFGCANFSFLYLGRRSSEIEIRNGPPTRCWSTNFR